MMFRLTTLLLLGGSTCSVLSFAPNSEQSLSILQQGNHRCDSATATATVFVRSQRLFSTATPETEDAVMEEEEADESIVGLLPEYQQALEKAKAAVSTVLSDAKPELIAPLFHFCTEYMTASQNSYLKFKDETSTPPAALKRILEGVQFGYQFGMGENKYVFGVTHEALRGNPETEEGNTLDYYAWGCNFFRNFMDRDESQILGVENLKRAMDQANAGENVVFFANHQSEADPQVMSLMLEKAGFAEEAARMIFVAGHKVTTDPLAIPFSMGRNLICIHSKKHIDADPETKGPKNRQNLAAMGAMLEKLKRGGCILWVAPSGGRDRRDVASGKTPIAPFDPKTVDMFRLMGRKSKVPTHYYPLAMVSYELCPPPDFVEAGVGEQRNFRFVPVGIKVGEEVTSDDFNPTAYEQTLKDYVELRELVFPGTAPEL